MANIALGTLLLFLLVIPGISFHKSFFYGPLSKKYSKLSAFDDFIWAIVPGIIFQLIFAFVINKIHPYNYGVNFVSIGAIFLGNNTASLEFENFEKNLGPIILYNSILIITAGMVGLLFRTVIRNFNLDHRYNFLRFSNDWFYILKGEVIFFNFKPADRKAKWVKRFNKLTENRAEREKKPYKELRVIFGGIKDLLKLYPKNIVNSCTANAVVKSDSGNSYIYSGTVIQFDFAKDGGINTIVLQNTQRRKFYDFEEPDFFEVPTDILVLKYSEIITLSVSAEKFEILTKKEVVEEAKKRRAKIVAAQAKKEEYRKKRLMSLKPIVRELALENISFSINGEGPLFKIQLDPIKMNYRERQEADLDSAGTIKSISE